MSYSPFIHYYSPLLSFTFLSLLLLFTIRIFHSYFSYYSSLSISPLFHIPCLIHYSSLPFFHVLTVVLECNLEEKNNGMRFSLVIGGCLSVCLCVWLAVCLAVCMSLFWCPSLKLLQILILPTLLILSPLQHCL